MLSREAKRRSSSTNSVSYPLISVLISGLVCYRLGVFSGCSNSWLNDIQETHESSWAPMSNEGEELAPMSNAGEEWATMSNEGEEVGQRSSSWKQPRKITDSNDRRSVSRTSIPYDCGVVFFYHIPSTGGASINRWFRKYQKPENGNITYYQKWALETRKDGSFHPDPQGCEQQFAEGMNEHIQNLGQNEWRIAHSHLTDLYLNESEHKLYKWRSDVEAQGCQLINTIMLRDPLNHAMSLYKIISAKNSTREKWTKYLSSPTEPGLWATVLDFFLYNNQGLRNPGPFGYPNGPGGRNPFNVSKEEKVTRALELLHRHFDIVTVGNHDAFLGTILNWTNWLPLEYKKSNVHSKEIPYTKKEVENLQKLLMKNGDVDFVDQVKMEYHDYLSYLDVE